jgi:pyrroline-5-carboxylate reductase
LVEDYPKYRTTNKFKNGGSKVRIAFIGGGNMADAILTGLTKSQILNPVDVTVSDASEDRLQFISQKHKVKTTTHNTEAIVGCDVIFVAVKPQIVPHLCAELKGVLQPEQTIASIAAGVTIASYTAGLSHNKIIRIMPNTPALVGQSMSVWTSTEAVPEGVITWMRTSLQAIGSETYVSSESILNQATALSGSGPAYAFKFIETLIEAGVLIGLSYDMSQELSIKTIQGSLALMVETERHPAELRNSVTSPGGTTAEALSVLAEKGFDTALLQAIRAAYKKSLELGG